MQGVYGHLRGDLGLAVKEVPCVGFTLAAVCHVPSERVHGCDASNPCIANLWSESVCELETV